MSPSLSRAARCDGCGDLWEDGEARCPTCGAWRVSPETATVRDDLVLLRGELEKLAEEWPGVPGIAPLAKRAEQAAARICEVCGERAARDLGRCWSCTAALRSTAGNLAKEPRCG